MKYYLAPLEGITTYIYRRAYHQHFAPMDKYFTPFLVPHTKKGFSTKEKNDVMPEHSPGMNLVPQIMSNQADSFLHTVEKLKVYGYEEVNLNLGCPSKTVVSKGRGSGFLADPDGLDHDAVEESKIPLCYNGDIFTPESYEEMKREFPQVDTFMLGRGILMNPALLDLIHMREKTDVKKTTDIDVTEWKKEETSRKMQSADRYKKEIHAFLEQIKCDYLEVGMGEKNTLFKLKELWAYMGQNAPEAKKALKRIRKSQSMADYDSASREALEDFILF